MTTEVPLLSERMRERTELDRNIKSNYSISTAPVLRWADEVAALERQLELGVEGLVPEGWKLLNVRALGGYQAELLRNSGDYLVVRGTGPTVEAAIKDAANKVMK